MKRLEQENCNVLQQSTSENATRMRDVSGSGFCQSCKKNCTQFSRMREISQSIENVAQVDEEINCVTELLLLDAGRCTLPLVCHGQKKKYTDRILKQLCSESAVARKTWRDAGRPLEGDIYEKKLRLRRAVRRRVRLCTAMSERKRIRRRERLFAEKHGSRFKVSRKKRVCERLLVKGEMVTDKEVLFGCVG